MGSCLWKSLRCNVLFQQWGLTSFWLKYVGAGDWYTIYHHLPAVSRGKYTALFSSTHQWEKDIYGSNRDSTAQAMIQWEHHPKMLTSKNGAWIRPHGWIYIQQTWNFDSTWHLEPWCRCKCRLITTHLPLPFLAPTLQTSSNPKLAFFHASQKHD